MDADWSVTCGADDPVVVIPWSSADGSLHYVELRDAPERVNEVPEAVQFPALARALRRWNRPGSPVFTAKCDVWSYPANHFDMEDLSGFAHAHASYIDLLASDTTVFSNFAVCEQWLRDWTDRARSIPLPATRCEWSLRRAHIFAPTEIAGFATTLYVWGYGSSPTGAVDAWTAALLALIEPILFPEPS